jgi:hypothetical protein
VAPVYKPEVAARAIAEVVRRPRRSTWVGASTVATILANRVAPWLLDRYLARTAVTGQQEPAHDPPSPLANTWRPLAGDLGAHGEFDDEAHAHSPQAWLTRHRGIALGALALAGAGAAVFGVPALKGPAPRRPLASRRAVRRRSRRGW